jgi:hypothetical protein
MKFSMPKKKLTYFAHFDIQGFLGVAKKIDQTVFALNQKDFEANTYLLSQRGVKGHWALFKAILFCRSDVLVLRTTYYTMHLLFFALCWQRLKGNTVIVEVPTPNVTVWNEIGVEWGRSFVGKWLRRGLLASSLPWSLWPAHKVVQYAPESWFFNAGLAHKTQLHANGIDLSKVPLRHVRDLRPSKKIVFLGMGILAPWHGYDRVIQGIANYLKNNDKNKISVELVLIGEGAVCQEWLDLARNLGVSQNLKFVGSKTGAELDAWFNVADIALGSLGLYRKGLNMASDLKSREYTARGIPFVAAGHDIDFAANPAFRLSLPNDESPIDISAVINWFARLDAEQCRPGSMRRYAQDYLDFGKKVEKLVAPIAD